MLGSQLSHAGAAKTPPWSKGESRCGTLHARACIAPPLALVPQPEDTLELLRHLGVIDIIMSDGSHDFRTAFWEMATPVFNHAIRRFFYRTCFAPTTNDAVSSDSIPVRKGG